VLRHAGIMDGGKGQSRHKGTTKKFNKASREASASSRQRGSAEPPPIGEWTSWVPYLDGLSDRQQQQQQAAATASAVNAQDWAGFRGGVTLMPLLARDGTLQPELSIGGEPEPPLPTTGSSPSLRHRGQHQLWGVISVSPSNGDARPGGGQSSAAQWELAVQQMGSAAVQALWQGPAVDAGCSDGPQRVAVVIQRRLVEALQRQDQGATSTPEPEPGPRPKTEPQLGMPEEQEESLPLPIVGLGCGLNYGVVASGEDGELTRAVQRAVCAVVMATAVQRGLAVCIECHNAPPPTDEGKGEGAQRGCNAVADIIRLMATTLLPDTAILIRCGDLTSCEKLPKLLRVFSNLRVGMSSRITYTKAPVALVNAACDTPLDRVVLTSEAPRDLPGQLANGGGGGRGGCSTCVPQHAACVASGLARLLSKGTTATPITAEAILRQSTDNCISLFGLTDVDLRLATSNALADEARDRAD
jgi:hypothetical protein